MMTVLEHLAGSDEIDMMVLVTSLATEWGCYRTRVGKAVYFILAASGDGSPGCGRAGHRTAGTAVFPAYGDLPAGRTSQPA